MNTRTKTARWAGVLYLLMVITGPFVLLYVPGKLFVPGDAAATTANILGHESLFRAYIVVGLISELVFIATVLLLYRLLKDVDRSLAKIMALLVLIIVPVGFVGLGNQVATLSFVGDANFMAAFDKPQRDALVTLLITFDSRAVLVSETFWGLWLLPLGVLVFRSGFLPRFLGIWLFINGIAYVAISFTGILIPEYLSLANRISSPALFGEVALMLWLLIKGAKPGP